VNRLFKPCRESPKCSAMSFSDPVVRKIAKAQKLRWAKVRAKQKAKA